MDYDINYKPIMFFGEIKQTDLENVGGKGLNLGLLANKGFPIPPGFCITTQSYYHFLDFSGLKEQIFSIIDSINEENLTELQEKTNQVKQLILNAKIQPELETQILKAYSKLGEKKLVSWIGSSEKEFVAVRASSTKDDIAEGKGTGQQDTFLNIIGNKKVMKAVKACWASLFNARAVYYRKKNNIPSNKVGISVVIQKMVNAKVSGIMFTSTPEGDNNKILIEAGYGLGSTIAHGLITPDNYLIDKGSIKILEKKISKQVWGLFRKQSVNKKLEIQPRMQKKQKLEDKYIIELSKIGKQIEQFYKKPQDIEWALENKELFIVQSRGITTLDLQVQKQKIKTDKKPIITGLGSSPGIVFGKAKIIYSSQEMNTIEDGDIIVTTTTTPDWAPIMKKAKALITNEGGKTCHAAIVSRELGIPAIVGTENATEVIIEGQEITVDGFTGQVFEGHIKASKPEKEEISDSEVIPKEEIKELEKAMIKELKKEISDRKEKHEIEKEIKELKKDKPETIERQKLIELLKERSIKVKVNVALPDSAEKASQTGAEGVGLLRAEHMITSSGIHPIKFIQENKTSELKKLVKQGIKKVVEFFPGKPVWYRTFDARTDEFRNLQGGELEPKEDNPMLGWHGIRRALDEPELIKTEFRAIKELIEEGYDNIGIMLPFVQSVEELQQAKSLSESIGLIPHTEIEFGIMIETPASVWIIDDIIKEGIDFVSFGTNDLTQLTLGVDRNNENIQKLFNAKHPAILKQLKYVIEKCNKAKIKTSICGQAASDPEMVKKLIHYGIASVSCNIDAVKKIKQLALKEEKEILMQEH